MCGDWHCEKYMFEIHNEDCLLELNRAPDAIFNLIIADCPIVAARLWQRFG